MWHSCRVVGQRQDDSWEVPPSQPPALRVHGQPRRVVQHRVPVHAVGSVKAEALLQRGGHVVPPVQPCVVHHGVDGVGRPLPLHVRAGFFFSVCFYHFCCSSAFLSCLEMDVMMAPSSCSTHGKPPSSWLSRLTLYHVHMLTRCCPHHEGPLSITSTNLELELEHEACATRNRQNHRAPADNSSDCEGTRSR